jgi:arylsulfatase A-like enzyme
MYEGGVRVPLIVHWPGVTAPGNTSDTPISSTDFYDTIAEMTGTAVPGNQGVDGRSLVPLLRQTGSLDRERFYWHYPHYHGAGNTPSGAIRSGSYKLVQYFATGEVELYDLSQDRREQNDLSGKRPTLTDSLLKQLQSWRDRVDAQMPEKNPNYRP